MDMVRVKGRDMYALFSARNSIIHVCVRIQSSIRTEQHDCA